MLCIDIHLHQVLTIRCKPLLQTFVTSYIIKVISQSWLEGQGGGDITKGGVINSPIKDNKT